MPAKNVLIVDDSPTELKVISEALSGLDCQLSTAGTAAEAMQKVEAESPAVLVLDIVLPDKSGLDVLRKLRKNAATKDTKVLILSARGEETDKQWGLKQGADGYMVKPFEDDQLAVAVDQMLSA